MEDHANPEWNRLVYFVSDVYKATKKFKAGEQEFLGERIRKTAVTVSVALNSMPEVVRETDFNKVYPIISSISVLETYLELAKKYKFLKDISGIKGTLNEVKEILYKIIQDGKEGE